MSLNQVPTAYSQLAFPGHFIEGRVNENWRRPPMPTLPVIFCCRSSTGIFALEIAAAGRWRAPRLIKRHQEITEATLCFTLPLFIADAVSQGRTRFCWYADESLAAHLHRADLQHQCYRFLGAHDAILAMGAGALWNAAERTQSRRRRSAPSSAHQVSSLTSCSRRSKRRRADDFDATPQAMLIFGDIDIKTLISAQL